VVGVGQGFTKQGVQLGVGDPESLQFRAADEEKEGSQATAPSLLGEGWGASEGTESSTPPTAEDAEGSEGKSLWNFFLFVRLRWPSRC
jgi:hypothetical protein